jgi:hypothetical protein
LCSRGVFCSRGYNPLFGLLFVLCSRGVSCSRGYNPLFGLLVVRGCNGLGFVCGCNGGSFFGIFCFFLCSRGYNPLFGLLGFCGCNGFGFVCVFNGFAVRTRQAIVPTGGGSFFGILRFFLCSRGYNPLFGLLVVRGCNGVGFVCVFNGFAVRTRQAIVPTGGSFFEILRF